jgi:hypothetical protein
MRPDLLTLNPHTIRHYVYTIQDIVCTIQSTDVIGYDFELQEALNFTCTESRENLDPLL